jgi:hypothetical protein
MAMDVVCASNGNSHSKELRFSKRGGRHPGAMPWMFGIFGRSQRACARPGNPAGSLGKGIATRKRCRDPSNASGMKIVKKIRVIRAEDGLDFPNHLPL